MSIPAAGARLRVLHVITEVGLGGAENLLLDTLRYQKARGHEVSVCSLRPDDVLAPAIREVCPLTTLDMGHALTPLVLWRLRRLLRRGRYDVVHSSLYQANLATRLVARLAGAPVNISSVHSPYTWMRRPHFLADRWTSHLADYVVTVSEAVRQFSIQREHLSPAKVVTLRNGIDLRRFDAITDREATRRDTRAALGYAPSDLVICVAARLYELKGHTYLFQALEHLLPRYPHLRLFLAGDGPHRPALEAECQARGLTARVQFLGARKDIPELLAACDIFVLPSLYEGLSLAVLEAMAMRCPVVATAVGGAGETIEDGVQGLLVPPADVAALERALERLLKDAALRQSLGEAGRGRVEAEFTLEGMMEKTEALYYQLLKRKAPERLSQPSIQAVATGEEE